MKVDSKEIASVLGISEAHIPLLVGSFLDESKEILEKLFVAVEARNYEEITLHAHSIKGSAANLRFDEITEVAKAIELSAKAEDTAFAYEARSKEVKALIESIEF